MKSLSVTIQMHKRCHPKVLSWVMTFSKVSVVKFCTFLNRWSLNTIVRGKVKFIVPLTFLLFIFSCVEGSDKRFALDVMPILATLPFFSAIQFYMEP